MNNNDQLTFISSLITSSKNKFKKYFLVTFAEFSNIAESNFKVRRRKISPSKFSIF